jgi:hypothetical protein
LSRLLNVTGVEPVALNRGTSLFLQTKSNGLNTGDVQQTAQSTRPGTIVPGTPTKKSSWKIEWSGSEEAKALQVKLKSLQSEKDKTSDLSKVTELKTQISGLKAEMKTLRNDFREKVRIDRPDQFKQSVRKADACQPNADTSPAKAAHAEMQTAED